MREILQTWLLDCRYAQVINPIAISAGSQRRMAIGMRSTVHQSQLRNIWDKLSILSLNFSQSHRPHNFQGMINYCFSPCGISSSKSSFEGNLIGSLNKSRCPRNDTPKQLFMVGVECSNRLVLTRCLRHLCHLLKSL